MTTENNKRTILCRGRVITFEEPRIAGILNITPDSFYDGGKYNNLNDIEKAVEEMLSGGATWIDTGAVSTRPRSESTDYKTELQRLEPVLRLISHKFPEALVSVDTFRADIARMAVEKYGTCMINDVSAGEMDSEMIKTAGQLKVPYIAMHMRETPATMQSEENTVYHDIINEIVQYLSLKKKQLYENGVSDIVVDPGFGFSKTIAQNFTLLKDLRKFSILDCPVMVGISRKSMIYKTLHCTADDALTGTLAAHLLALVNGADILRVHDVKETSEVIKIFKQYSMS